MDSGEMLKQSHRTVGDLVGLIYQAAIDPSLWGEFRRQFTDATGSHGSRFSYQDHDSPKGEIAIAQGYEAPCMRQYAEHFANVTAMRSRRPFGEEERALWELLMPHMERAIQLHGRVATMEAERSASLEALDHLAAGVVLVKGNAEVMFLNRVARQIVAQDDGLRIGASGLSAANSREARELRGLISKTASTASGPAASTSSGGIIVSRPSGRRPFSLFAVPLLTAGEVTSAIILISDPEANFTADLAELQRWYALTPAEARIASVLMSGKSVEEAAAELQVSIHTARTHLKRVLAKTGTRRQGELIHLLLRSFSQLRAPADRRQTEDSGRTSNG